MNVVVDTCVWSLALRRQKVTHAAEVNELAELIREGRAALLGPVRQEILAGMTSAAQHETLRVHLKAFPDVVLESEDYEQAAAYFNRCRANGVQGSNTDFLICAVATRRRFAILTTDADFALFARIVPIQLHTARAVNRG